LTLAGIVSAEPTASSAQGTTGSSARRHDVIVGAKARRLQRLDARWHRQREHDGIVGVMLDGSSCFSSG